MNMTRWIMAAALGLLGSSWAKADSLPPPDGHYLIDLEAWDPFQSFNFTPNPTLPSSTNPCLPAGDACGDASIRVDNGGGSTPESGDYTFSLGSSPSETFYFDNTGPPILSIEISTILNPDEYGDLFSCSGGAIFQQCGFVLELDDPAPTGETLDAYFYDPYDPSGIPSVVPEPSQWFVLLIGFAAVIVVARARKGSASSSFAQTQR
jgi:hypothetical protein